MNITFNLKNEEMTKRFLSQAEEEGFVGLKGYKLRGGIRASLYNAVTKEETMCLASFMKKVARELK
jgi:phosphoserine aminotransferase